MWKEKIYDEENVFFTSPTIGTMEKLNFNIDLSNPQLSPAPDYNLSENFNSLPGSIH